MIKCIFFFLSAITIVSCSFNEQIKSTHPNAAYFYPIDSIPKIYLYRDVANGLDEEFHRVYSLGDKAGEHIIVERYSSDGRILEALNYNVDSLDLQDHMVVNFKQEKTKAQKRQAETGEGRGKRAETTGARRDISEHF